MRCFVVCCDCCWILLPDSLFTSVSICSEASNRHRLQCLVPGVSYEVFVQATLDDIRGAQTQTVSFCCKCLPPDQPMPPMLKQATKNSLLLTWTPPVNDNGSKITVYKLFAVEVSPRSLSVSIIVVGLSMKYVRKHSENSAHREL